MDYPTPINCATEVAKCDASPSLVEMLREKKLRLESQLKETNEALTALEANPEVMRVLHLVTKAGRF